MKRLFGAVRNTALVLWYVGWVLAVVPVGAWALNQGRNEWWETVAFSLFVVVVIGMVTDFIPKYILLSIWRRFRGWIILVSLMMAFVGFAFGAEALSNFIDSLQGSDRTMAAFVIGGLLLAMLFGTPFPLLRFLWRSFKSTKEKNS